MTPLAHTGHVKMPSGGLVRLDIEKDQWVGRLYSPALKVRVRVVGPLEIVQAAMREWK